MMLGFVCGTCDTYNDPGIKACSGCGATLAADEAFLPATPPAASDVTTGTPPAMLDASKAAAPPGDALASPASQILAPPPVDMPRGVSSAILAPPSDITSPARAARGTAARCTRCGMALGEGDKFCRNCGVRVGDFAPPPAIGALSQPLGTTQIAAMTMPAPGVVAPALPQSSTMVMPAMHAATLGAPPQHTLARPGATADQAGRLMLVRGQSSSGTQWRINDGELVVGRAVGTVRFSNDSAIAKRHCRVVRRGAEHWLEPEETTNGVFLRVRERTMIATGDEFVVGAQRLRVLATDERVLRMVPAHDTPVLGSIVRPFPPIALLRVAADPALHEAYFRCQRLLTLGRSNCDVNFAQDTFVSERHAQISSTAAGLVLEDLRSRNGTYVRVRAPIALTHGDLILVSENVLRFELPRER